MNIKKYLLKTWCILPLRPQFKRTVRQYITYVFFSRKFTIGVLGIIPDTDGNIMLFEHTYLEDGPWGIPGGGAKHEDLKKALAREVKEESNFDITVGDLIAIVHEGGRGINLLFSCKQTSHNYDPEDGEIRGYAFFPLNQLPNVTAPHAAILRQLTYDGDGNWSVANGSGRYINSDNGI